MKLLWVRGKLKSCEVSHAELAHEKIINFLLGEVDNIQFYEQQLLQNYEPVVRKY